MNAGPLKKWLPVFSRHRLFIIVLAAVLVTRLFLLGMPNFAVFDESIYVDVAYNIARLSPEPVRPMFGKSPVSVITLNPVQAYGNFSKGQDYNYEHPPLAKIIMAFFVWTFSPDTVSYFWARVPSILVGGIGIVAFYGIALHFLSKRNALLAVTILSFDTLFWEHSRAALLDVYLISFMMLGIYFFLKKQGTLSAVMFALAMLTKISAGFGVAFIIGYALITERSWKNTKHLFEYGLTTAILAGLGYLALIMLVGVSPNPLTTLEQMRYGLFQRADWRLALIMGSNPISQPWDWLFNLRTIRYALLFEPSTGLVLIDVRGMMNPAVIFMAIPTLFLAAHRWFKQGDKLGLFSAGWFLWMYMPYLLPTWLGQEQFLHHMVAAMPPLALAIASFLKEQPRAFKIAYVMTVLLFFAYYYPYRWLWLLVFPIPRVPLPDLTFFG